MIHRWSSPEIATPIGPYSHLAAVPPGLTTIVVAALEGTILLTRAADDPAVLEQTGATLAGLLGTVGS